MIDIEKLLRNCNELTDYKINRIVTRSYELFFVHSKLETVRSTDTESVGVTVYRDHDGKKGNSSFKIYASTTEEEAKAKIDDAAGKALLIDNEMYDIPSKEEIDGEIYSNFSEHDMKFVAARMAEAVFSADMLGMGSVNALEIFINKHDIYVKNSRGLNKHQVKYTSMIEAIPTWTNGESVELYEAINTSTLDVNAIKTELEAKMREVRDRGTAKAPIERLDCPVLLHSHEIATLVENIAEVLDYSTVYAQSNPFSEGDSIQKNNTGDGLSITLRGQIEGCASSSMFDSEGSTLVDTRIVENGVVTAYHGTHRFAQYLGRATTGALACTEVGVGTLDEATLNAKPYFECVSMSGLQVDVFNDYIGGEVRLAYYFDGEKKIPVTGVSISGKLSEALAHVKLYNKATQWGDYMGPDKALFERINIV